MKNVREFNEVRVLRAVRDEGPISRASLARRLRLSKAAMSGITNRLVEKQLVLEVGKGTSTKRGGRREVLLALNPRAGVIPVIEIEQFYVSVGLMDLKADIISRHVIECEIDEDPKKALDQAIQEVRRMIADEDVSAQNVFGIGLAIAGIIDYEKGLVREARTRARWCGFPLRAYLENQFGVPVFIENDVKALTLSEFQYGAGRTVKDFLAVWIGEGVGAGIVINGRLLRGASSSAGEIEYNAFGHFDDSAGKTDLILRAGVKTWGDVLTHQRLIESYTRLIGSNNNSREPKGVTVGSIITAAHDGDVLARRLLYQFGWVLGTLCINLIHTLNPPMVILAGILFEDTDIVIDAVRERVSQDILRAPLEAAAIEKGMLKTDAVLMGAGALVLEDFFHVPDHWVRSRSRTALMEAI